MNTTNALFGDLERRSAWLQARVTPGERAFVETEAKKRGLTVSELTRAALGAFLLRAIEHETPPRQERG